ncbi:MAG: toxin-antitoxin system YwqK family antitoxin [Pseudomonadota bacterium]
MNHLFAFCACAAFICMQACGAQPSKTPDVPSPAAEDKAAPACQSNAGCEAGLICHKALCMETVADAYLEMLIPFSIEKMDAAAQALECPAGTKTRLAKNINSEMKGSIWLGCVKGEQIHGPFIMYMNAGDPSWIEFGYYRNGRLDGFSASYYLSGKPSEKATYGDGKLEGTWTMWNENGNKHSEGAVQNGLKEGPWTFWHENGQKSQAGEYHLDKKVGPWAAWYGNGKPLGKGRNHADAPCGEWQCWNEWGEPDPCKSFEFEACAPTDAGASCPPCEEPEGKGNEQ